MQICTVLNSLCPTNNVSKCSRKLCYGKISFIVLVLGRLTNKENDDLKKLNQGWIEMLKKFKNLPNSWTSFFATQNWSSGL